MGFLLLVSLLVGMGITNDANLLEVSLPSTAKVKKGGTYALNGPKPSKFALQVLLVGAVIQTRHDQRLERITTDVRVVMRRV